MSEPIYGVVGEQIICGAYGEDGGMYVRIELAEQGPGSDAMTCDMLYREALRLISQLADACYDLERGGAS